MITTTLCYLLKDEPGGGRVLLALKKRGLGTGRWNGVGGKAEPGEEPRAAAAREAAEEIRVRIDADGLAEAAFLKFRWRGRSERDQDCHVFTARTWSGEPVESDEVRPAWYDVRRLPFETMWPDDRHWLPLVLAGKRIKGEFWFDEDGEELLNFGVSEIRT